MVKGNVLATARVAATLAVKNTANIIPMCHPVPISSITVDFSEGDGFIEVTVVVKMTGQDRGRDGGVDGSVCCSADGVGHGEVGREG